MNQKTVDIYEYMAILREQTEQGKEVSMRITGSSMVPFLVHARDRIYFKKPDRALRRGDMVFYRRTSGQYVMHRICHVHGDGSLDLIGDGQTIVEHHVQPEQVFGLITRVQRKGRLLTEGDLCWDFFRQIWIRIIPLRAAVLHLYRMLKKI